MRHHHIIGSDHTLKAIRQALGVGSGGKVAFDFTGDSVIVTRVTDEPHEDNAIRSFLALQEKDIKSGRYMTSRIIVFA